MHMSRRGFLRASGLALGALVTGRARADAQPPLTVQAVYARSPILRDIRDRARAGVASHPRVRHVLAHDERVLLATALLGVPGGRDEIHEVMRCCPDYDMVVTDVHVERLRDAMARGA